MLASRSLPLFAMLALLAACGGASRAHTALEARVAELTKQHEELSVRVADLERERGAGLKSAPAPAASGSPAPLASGAVTEPDLPVVRLTPAASASPIPEAPKAARADQRAVIRGVGKDVRAIDPEIDE